MKDWVEWHAHYDDPTSEISRRLVVVRRRIGEALDELGSDGTRRVLSLCAGDGRDILPELAARPGLAPEVVLVELTSSIASDARRRAATLELAHVDVRAADAGATAAWSDVLPVDLLLLCGIFGNVSEDDIRASVTAARSLVRRGGIVIWTRGDMEPELRPAIRAWCTDEGFDEVAFDGAPQAYGVGVCRRPSDDPRPEDPIPERLFTFIR